MHPSGLRLRRPYSNQHRSINSTEFRTRNNANTFKLQRTITNALRYKSDPSGNVVNLSKHSFSFDTYKLLNKNLNFIPTSERYKNQLSSDLQNFFRLIILRAHFKDETCIATVNQPNEQVPFKIKNKEKWTPKEKHDTVSTYIDLVENDINALMKEPTKKLKSNLTYKEHAAMEELAKRKDLITTNVDKGRAVIIMDTYSYIREANQQLSDKASYK